MGQEHVEIVERPFATLGWVPLLPIAPSRACHFSRCPWRPETLADDRAVRLFDRATKLSHRAAWPTVSGWRKKCRRSSRAMTGRQSSGHLPGPAPTPFQATRATRTFLRLARRFGIGYLLRGTRGKEFT